MRQKQFWHILSMGGVMRVRCFILHNDPSISWNAPTFCITFIRKVSSVGVFESTRLSIHKKIEGEQCFYHPGITHEVNKILYLMSVQLFTLIGSIFWTNKGGSIEFFHQSKKSRKVCVPVVVFPIYLKNQRRFVLP